MVFSGRPDKVARLAYATKSFPLIFPVAAINTFMSLPRVDERTGANQGKPQTLAQQCCAGNLEYIAKSVTMIRDTMRQVSTCFEQKRNRDGLDSMTTVHQDLRSLENAIRLFAEAQDGQQAQGSLDASKRAYQNLMKSLARVPSCEGAPSAKPPVN